MNGKSCMFKAEDFTCIFRTTKIRIFCIQYFIKEFKFSRTYYAIKSQDKTCNHIPRKGFYNVNFKCGQEGAIFAETKTTFFVPNFFTIWILSTRKKINVGRSLSWLDLSAERATAAPPPPTALGHLGTTPHPLVRGGEHDVHAPAVFNMLPDRSPNCG